MKNQIASFIVIALGLSACQKNESNNPPPQIETATPVKTTVPDVKPTPIQTEKKVLSPDGIEVILTKKTNAYFFKAQRPQFIENLNKYSVFVRVPPKTLSQVRIYKTDLQQDRTQEINYEDFQVVDGAIQFTDSYELPKMKYVTQKILYKVVSDSGEVLIQAQFDLVPDLYIEGPDVLAAHVGLNPGNITVANIVLDKTDLITDGANYHIRAENLIVNESTLQSFEGRNPQAKTGLPGRSGGRFSIEATNADGHLVIALHGEKGGQGYPGIDNSGMRKGKNGSPGADGYVVDDGIGMCFTREQNFVREDFARSYGEEIERRCPKELRCQRAPTNGTAGEDGVAGGDGFKGAEGGNAGVFLLQYKSGNFTFENRTEQGAGGEGGLGGKGSAAGDGGPPGSRGRDEYCPAASPGPNGKPGATGATGASGVSGVFEKSCVKNNNQAICQ